MKDKIDLTRLTHYEKLEIFCKQIKKTDLNLVKSIFHINIEDAIKEFGNEQSEEHFQALLKRCCEETLAVVNGYDDEFGYNHSVLQASAGTDSKKLQMQTYADQMGTRNVLGLYTLMNFYRSHKKVYKLSNALANKLHYTKTNCKIDNIQSPHACLYVQLPIDFHIPFDEDYNIDGVYIDRSFFEERGVWVFYFTPRVKFPKGDITKDVNKLMPLSPLYNNDMYVTVDVTKEDTIDKMIKTLKAAYKGSGTGSVSNLDTEGNEWYRIEDLCQGVTLAINTILYITSECSNKEYIEVFKSKKDIFSNKRRTSNADYIHVGKDIEIDNQIQSIYYTKGNGVEIQARFIVSGHWHHYWMKYNEDLESFVKYNEDKSKVLIRKWVEPYWKGPEYAQIISNQYAVK